MVSIIKNKNKIIVWGKMMILLSAIVSIIIFLFFLYRPYAILGQLSIFKNPIFNDEYTYDLLIGYKKVGYLNVTDTWKIQNEFVYGVMSHTVKEKNDSEKYFLFNCKNNEIMIMDEWKPFVQYMKSKGLYDTDFIMDGENPVNLKYNKRIFSSICPK